MGDAVGAADAAIGCWDAKFTYNFWRPVTAIGVGGGNPNLVADADWTPLGITPNHPEYPAAHGCVTGAVASLIRDYFRTRKVHIVVDSLAFTDGVHTHTFDDTRDLFEEVSPVTRLTCRLRFVQKTVRVLTSAYSPALARALLFVPNHRPASATHLF